MFLLRPPRSNENRKGNGLVEERATATEINSPQLATLHLSETQVLLPHWHSNM